MPGDHSTVFRIDAIIGGHAAGFKVAAKEAARGAAGLRQEVGKYSAAQAAANRESNKAKDTLAKQIVAQKQAAKATAEQTRHTIVYNAQLERRQRFEKEVTRSAEHSTVAQALLNEKIKQGVRNLTFLTVASEKTTKALKDEGLAAVEAAVGLMTKDKASRSTEESQKDLALAAWEAAKAMGHEGKEAIRTATALALKGRESRKSARDQIELAAASDLTRKRLRDEREETRKLNFEFQRHRGVLASNIRSQPLFAATVASITAALGPLASGLGDATAGAVALGGGLEPLLGNLALVPSLAGAAAQGLGVFAIGMRGVFKTLRAQGTTYQNNLAKLTKPAQEFVKTLRGPVFGNAFKELQLQIQTGLFPGLTKGLKAAMPLLKPFAQVMWDTSKAIGNLGEQWGKFFGSKGFGHEFVAIGERNRQTITRLGTASISIFDALTKVLVAAGPFVGHFTADIVKGAKAIDDFITKAKNNGDLRLYFAEVEARTKQWLKILGSTITFFHNLFEAARPLTDVIVNSWVKGAAAASDWAKNSQGLKDFFVSAKAPLAAMAHLIGALATGIADLAVENQKNLAGLVNTLADHVVPALHEIAQFFADLMPAISKTLGVLADSIKTIVSNAGDLKTALKIALGFIRGIAKGAAEISKHFGATGVIIVGAAALGGLRLMNSLIRTGIKLLRDKAFDRLGVDVIGDNLRLTRGKGILGGLIPAKGKKAAAQSAERQVFNQTRNAAVSAGIGGGTATLIGARAAVPGLIRAASYKVLQGAATAVERAPLIGAGVAAGMFIVKGIQGKPVHQAAAEALTNVFTGGIMHFKDYGKIDAAGNKLMDQIQSRVRDIARRRKLSIPVTFDIKGGPLDEKTKMGQLFTDFIAELQHTVSATKNKTQTWGSYFTELKTNVAMNMKRIANETKKGSEQAQQAFAANFNTAAHAVLKSMQDMGKFTKSGIAQVGKYLRQALSLYGIKGRDATAYINSYVYRGQHPGDTGTGANEGSNAGLSFGKEAGGYVTSPGLRGKDKRHIVVGDGEAVLTSHHQKPVEAALQHTYGFGLRTLFKDKRPHYMAQGGFVANRSWPMLSGDLDFLPTVGNRLEKLGEKSGQHIFVQSGRRSLSEQAALYKKYGPGRAAAPTANAPHVRGIAADITPGESVFGALAKMFGLGFTVPGEPWHIQLLDGSAASSAGGGQASTLKRALVRMGGAPGLIAQSGVDLVRNAAQSLLNSAVSSSSSTSGDGNVSVGGISGKGHPARNKGIARGMMRAFGWGADQWPALDQLWTRESGWDEYAVNKGSGAAGIPQALGHGNVFRLGDATAQIRWGEKYIKDRYGNPAAAWAHEVAQGWYGTGGPVGTMSRTPPPTIPLNQGATAPTPAQKPSRAMNPFTKKYETHTKAEWEKIREKYAASHRKKMIGAHGKPPIGKKYKRQSSVKKKKNTKHGKRYKNALSDVNALQNLPALVSGIEFERVANVIGDNENIAVKSLNLDKDQQIIAGLFDIKSGAQVQAMPTYDSDTFELRDVVNWDGGVDAQSLDFIPGIHHHVDGLTKERGYEDKIIQYLNWGVTAYQKRVTDASNYAAKYLAEMNELGGLVSFLRERKAAADKQYNREVRHHGTWQDRIAWNQDELSGLRKWLSENSDANTNQAKSYKKQAHSRIGDLEDQNRHLRQTKPQPSKHAKDAISRKAIYGNDLNGLTGNSDPAAPPDDVTKWNTGGVVKGVVNTYRALIQTIGETTTQINDITTDDASGLPAHRFNIQSINDEIAEWMGSHLAAQGTSASAAAGGGDAAAVNELLKTQLTAALQAFNLQSMQSSVFEGLAPYIGRFQHGGWVPQTGMAMLERGEYVVPDPQGPNPAYGQQAGPSPVHVTLVLDGHAASLVKLVDQRIDKKAPLVVNQTLGRKGRLLNHAPGRP